MHVANVVLRLIVQRTGFANVRKSTGSDAHDLSIILGGHVHNDLSAAS